MSNNRRLRRAEAAEYLHETHGIRRAVGTLAKLAVVGLMCLPPLHEAPAMHFALLAEIARRHGLAALSMGMTADFETAIRLGATHVRLGTAVFGPRGST